jgi:CRP/FNR family cyclic AMP-dependent transcriptional regulator
MRRIDFPSWVILYSAASGVFCQCHERERRKRKKAHARATKTDPYVSVLLQKIEHGKTVLSFQKGRKVFSQGQAADAVYFIETGKIKLTVVSPGGKEAIIAVLGPRDFLGEGCLVGHSFRINSSTALESTRVFRIEKAAMIKALHEQLELSEKFVGLLLSRNIDLEADLCDQLFNHSEKRLARVLLKLARLRPHAFGRDAPLPEISHETLAEMVGTTRSRITTFMNKFRKLGLIDYNGELVVRTEMLTDLVLHD